VEVTVGDQWLRLNEDDTWLSSGDRKLVSVRPVRSTDASGHPDFSADREPTTLFVLGAL
jgi:hypothetical protein